jgi:predicted phosphate transport protein (TIGR00153 family)
MLRLIPREERFFDMFVEDAANVLKGARQLQSMLRTYEHPESEAKELFAIEHHGDEISHAIGDRLNRTFVTPFDREDIHALTSTLDDILDLIEEAADTFVLYGIDRPTPEAIEQAGIIVQQCEILHEALTKLRKFRDLDRYWIEIHRLENEGDRVTRAAVASLFSGDRPPVDIIKWKDIYAILESCIDKCEDVANIIEKIAIKHA